MAFWVNTVCLDHVGVGVAEGIVQADHGSPRRLARLSRGDGIAMYSPRTTMRGGDPVQAFTAIGAIDDDECYQVHLRPGFSPWRRSVEWARSRRAPIRPLLPELSFTRDRDSWGIVFRRGLFEVPEDDFGTIAAAMAAPSVSPVA